MFRPTTRHPVFALALGALAGGLLSMYAVVAVTGESPWDAINWGSLETDDLAAMQRARLLELLFLAATFGGFGGAVIGGALWLAFTSRPLPSFLVILAWWLLGVIGGLLLAAGVLALPAMSHHLSVGRDGSGGPGVAFLVFVIGMAGIVIGSLVGVGLGIVKVRARNRAAIPGNRSQS